MLSCGEAAAAASASAAAISQPDLGVGLVREARAPGTGDGKRRAGGGELASASGSSRHSPAAKRDGKRGAGGGELASGSSRQSPAAKRSKGLPRSIPAGAEPRSPRLMKSSGGTRAGGCGGTEARGDGGGATRTPARRSCTGSPGSALRRDVRGQEGCERLAGGSKDLEEERGGEDDDCSGAGGGGESGQCVVAVEARGIMMKGKRAREAARGRLRRRPRRIRRRRS